MQVVLAVVVAAAFALTAAPYLAYLGLYAWLRPSGSPADKRPAEPPVSVVIPTYNEADIVESRLEDLLDQSYPMEKVEVVVTDSSTDDTVAVVESFFEGRSAPSLTVVEEAERSGVATAVNRAVAAASHDVVFRTDADSRLSEDAIATAVENLADPEVAGVTGRQTEVIGDSRVEADYRDLIALIQGVESELDSTFIAHGPCFAFETGAFEPIEADTVADDTAIAVGVRRGGKRVVMDPGMRFAESGVSGFRERRKRKDRRAMGLIQALVRNRDALGRYGRYGRVVLPFNWLFMVVSPLLVALDALLASALAVAVAGLPGLAVPLGIVAFVWLGQRDSLGPLQAAYAVVDSQVSLLVGGAKLVTGGADATWSIDRDSREVFE
jgi:cellulose synthase/poly-beta-1,6-N-acetylglucosamine synthase-like glycosyltransferase